MVDTSIKPGQNQAFHPEQYSLSTSNLLVMNDNNQCLSERPNLQLPHSLKHETTVSILGGIDDRAEQGAGGRAWEKMKKAKQMKNKHCYWKTGCFKTRGPGINIQISIQIIYLNFWSAILFKELNPKISRCYAKKLCFFVRNVATLAKQICLWVWRAGMDVWL